MGRGKKKRASAKKNANARARRKIHRRYKALLLKDNSSQPHPLVVLSDEQCEYIRHFALEVALEAVVKRAGEQFLRFTWRKVKQGDSYCTKTKGCILLRTESLFDENISGGSHLKRSAFAFAESPRGKGGGIALLAIWNNTPHSRPEPFTTAMLTELVQVKNPIFSNKENKHYGSRGQYYGFGSRASFGSLRTCPLQSSVGQYARKYPNSEANVMLDDKLKAFVSRSVEQGCKTIDSIFSGKKGHMISRLGSALSHVLAKTAASVKEGLEQHLHDIGTHGYTTAFFNYNAETLDEHTEQDITMTLICVPVQGTSGGSMTERYALRERGASYDPGSFTSFNFYLRGTAGPDDTVEKVVLSEEMALLFNGFFLVHRQERQGNKHNLMNISAYGNKRLHCNAKKTIIRNFKTRQKRPRTCDRYEGPRVADVSMDKCTYTRSGRKVRLPHRYRLGIT